MDLQNQRDGWLILQEPQRSSLGPFGNFLTDVILIYKLYHSDLLRLYYLLSLDNVLAFEIIGLL